MKFAIANIVTCFVFVVFGKNHFNFSNKQVISQSKFLLSEFTITIKTTLFWHGSTVLALFTLIYNILCCKMHLCIHNECMLRLIIKQEKMWNILTT